VMPSSVPVHHCRNAVSITQAVGVDGD